MDSDTSKTKNDEHHGTPSKKRKMFVSNNNDSLDATTNNDNFQSAEDLLVNISSTNATALPCLEDDNTKDHSVDKLHQLSSTPERISGASSPASSVSESDWQPPTGGALDWIYSQIVDDKNPREIINHLMPNMTSIPSHLSDWDVWRVLIRMLSEPARRSKLPHVNTFDDVIRLIKSSKKIMVLTGAGVSVSCGIPDFRSRDGVYARLAVDFPDLPNPEAMFSINYFQHDPRPFFKFAKEIYPGQFEPSPVHRFIHLLEKQEKLLRNYTQNIDTLEQVAGITRVVQCHGSFSTATCRVCKHHVSGDDIREDVFKQVVPICPRCSPGEEAGILKPDIVFFGENLPDHFHRQMTADKDEVDLLVVIGSALKVRPVALIPNSLPEEVPQILINREPLPHLQFDVELLGDADGVIAQVALELGAEFGEIHEGKERLSEITALPEARATSQSACDVASGDGNDAIDAVGDVSRDDVIARSDDVSDMSSLWQSRWKQSISKCLPAGTYHYDGKHRYIFPGAELAPEEVSDCSSDESSSSSSDDDDSDPVPSATFHMDPSTPSTSAAPIDDAPPLVYTPIPPTDADGLPDDTTI